MTQAPLATDAMAQSVAPEDKIDFKKIFPIFVIVLIDLLGLTIIIPLMPLYATAYGASAFGSGMLGGTYPIFQFIAAPILGRLSDRYGRKPILVISQFTLYADTRRGRRPSFVDAAAPDDARLLIATFVETLQAVPITVEEGIFGADMAVSLTNDGPVTILLEQPSSTAELGC